LIMAWAFEMTPEGIKADSDTPSDSITPATGQRLNYVILGLVVLAVGFLVTDQYVLDQGIGASVVGSSRPAVTIPTSTSSTPSALVRRYYIDLGPTRPKGGALINADIAISRDGRRLVYAILRGSDRSQLYLRELDQLDAQLISGTDGAANPFFSPNGELVAFYSGGGNVQKISVRGGPPQLLAENVRIGTGGFWSSDDTVFFTSGVPGGFRLHRIAAVGGVPELLDPASEDIAVTHAWPHVLPNGDAVLFTTSPTDSARDGQIVLLTLETGEVQPLIQGAYNARYAPTGHIVFMRSATL